MAFATKREEASSLLLARESNSSSAVALSLGSSRQGWSAWLSQRGFLGVSHGAWVGAGVALATTIAAASAAAAIISVHARRIPPAPADACAWPQYRLPSGSAPESYSVRWDISKSFSPPYSFSGATEIVVTRAADAAADISCLLLHARGLSFTGAAAAATEDGANAGLWLPLDLTDDPLPLSERVIVRLPRALIAQPRLRLSFNFTGILSNTGIAFYYSSYTNGSIQVPLVQTKFEPAFARTAFPCFDEPALKARFNLSLAGVPTGYTALANMPVIAESADGARTFAESPVMSSYQLTFVAAPMLSMGGVLAPSPVRAAPVSVRVWTMDRGPASLLGGLAFANATAIAVMALYETVLATAYPLPKMDLVYLPVFAVGAMEQWGLITYTESYLLAGINGSASAASVIAHELAHQNFGNLVTADWWSCLWLQEGMATFWPYTAVPAIAPQFDYAASWRAATSGAMAEDAYAASQALTVATPVASSGASYAVFGAITYDKGAAVIAGLQRRVDGAGGAGAFDRALTTYLAAHAHAAVQPQDLIGALVLAAPGPLAGLAGETSQLLYAPGVPLVTAAWAADGPASKTLVLTQTRFFAGAASAASAGGQPAMLWTIPLVVLAGNASAALAAGAAMAASALEANGGLTGATLQGLTLAYDPSVDGWLSLTDGSPRAYFRTLLPAEAYDAMAAALAGGTGELPPADARAALIDDLFAAAEAGVGPGAAYALSWAARWVAADSAPAVRAAVAARVTRLAALLTDDVPLAAAGNVDVRPAAATPGTPAAVCLQALLTYSGARLGVSAAALAAVNRSTLGANRHIIAAALGAPFDASNVSAIFSAVATGASRDMAYMWLRARWPAVWAFLGFRSTLATLVRSVVRGFTSAAYADDAAATFAALQAGPYSAPVIDGAWQRAVEQVRANAAWAASADASAVCALVSASDVASVSVAGTAPSLGSGTNYCDESCRLTAEIVGRAPADWPVGTGLGVTFG